MGSIKPPKTAFSDKDLAELEWVFTSVCATLAVDGSPDEEEKAALRRRLFVLACNGMSEPETLRDHLVNSFRRSKSSRFRKAQTPATK